MKKTPALLFFFLFFVSPLRLPAQTSTPTQPSTTATEDDDAAMVSTQFDMSGFPQWAKDLRRAEIVAFGSFPFAYFFSNFAFDTYRSATRNWDRRYAPWPIKGEGAVEQSQNEKIRVLWIAAGSAVAISLIDYGIMRFKRSRQAREIKNLPPGTPIIIRRPLSAEDGEGSDAAPPADAEPAAP